MTKPSIDSLMSRVQDELVTSLIPFWLAHSQDPAGSGFVGELTNDLRVIQDARKGLILNARLLWAFSAAARFTGDPECRRMADYAFTQLRDTFWDQQFGGAYWELTSDAKPADTCKKTYGQGFLIYAMSEYYLLTQSVEAMELARQTFRLIETHAWNADSKGYLEVFDRDWRVSDSQQLSAVDLSAPVSMNAQLHILEAYLNLYPIWKDDLLGRQLKGLIELFRDKILDAQTMHFRLFFDLSWRSQSTHISYGHDIEGSWLLCRAAEALGDRALQDEMDKLAVRIAETTLAEGLGCEHGLIYESDGMGHKRFEYEWWCQAEAAVGFLNAFQLSGRPEYLEAAEKFWQFIERYQKDRSEGRMVLYARRTACAGPVQAENITMEMPVS
jgi:cellobiose epimerase